MDNVNALIKKTTDIDINGAAYSKLKDCGKFLKFSISIRIRFIDSIFS